MNPLLADSVIDVLATWGATATPAAAELLEVLSERATREPTALLRKALELPADLLDPELRRELDDVHASLDGSPGVAAVAAPAVDGLLDRVARELEPGLSGRAEELATSFQAWALLMAPEERRRALGLIVDGGDPAGPTTVFERYERLERLEMLLAESRERRLAEIRDLLQGAEANSLQAEDRERATEALHTEDAQRSAELVSRLEQVRRHRRRTTLEQRHTDASRRVTEVGEEVAHILGDPASGLDGSTRRLLGAAYEAALGSAGAPSPDENRLEELATYESTLRDALQSHQTMLRSETDRREALARRMLDELRAESGEASMDDAEQALSSTAVRGGPKFQQALTLARSKLHELRESGPGGPNQAAESLREWSSRLKSLLASSAALLPTEDVVRARLLLDQTEPAAKYGSNAESEALQETIRKQVESLAVTAEHWQARIRDRSGAQRENLRREVKRLLDLGASAERQQLETFLTELKNADADALPTIEKRLKQSAAAIENDIRLRSATLVDRSGRTGDSGSDERMLELRSALDGDDLALMAEISSELEPRSRESHANPLVRIGLIAAGLLLAVSIPFGWHWLRSRPIAYEFTLENGPASAEPPVLVLVRDGAVHSQSPFGPDGTTSVRLDSGRFDIYVDDQYTGRSVVVPDDPQNVDGIRLPLAADPE